MQEYVTRVERLRDGSLRTTLFRGGRRVHQEPVRTLRQGKRRAHDLLCSAVDTELDADRSAGSVVPRPGRPVVGSSARNAARGLSARVSAEAFRAAATSPSGDAALRAVIGIALRSGPWDAACISLLGPDGAMLPAVSSDEDAAEADRRQFEAGAGPCLDAVHPEPGEAGADRMVVAVDLSNEHRWPGWGPAATALGYRGVVAVRLVTDHAVGSISLYASQPRVLDRGALENARVVAALASVVLAQVCTEQELRRAVHSRGLIGQAQGMLMQRYGVTPEQAFVVLRRYSQLRNTTLVVLAEHFTTTGVLPDLPGPQHGRERMP
jgi:GAF domain-containing protein